MRKREKTPAWRIAELQAMPYQQYLRTIEWYRRRAVKLKIVGHRCQLCNSGENLNVHHRTYERIGCEKMEDLLVLCRNCHQTFHERLKLVNKCGQENDTLRDYWLADTGDSWMNDEDEDEDGVKRYLGYRLEVGNPQFDPLAYELFFE